MKEKRMNATQEKYDTEVNPILPFVEIVVLQGRKGKVKDVLKTTTRGVREFITAAESELFLDSIEANSRVVLLPNRGEGGGFERFERVHHVELDKGSDKWPRKNYYRFQYYGLYQANAATKSTPPIENPDHDKPAEG
jgi:hypothetical protein